MPIASPAVVIGHSVMATKYSYVASATVLIWDMTLTMNQEYRRVWQVKKTFGTALFLCNRYLPPAVFLLDLVAQFWDDPSSRFCKNYELASTVLDIVSISNVECVLIIRTHALYQNKTLFHFLCVLGTLSTLNMLVCFLVLINHETFMAASSLGLSGCLSGCTAPMCRPLVIIFWTPFIIFETIIFSLTTWKSYSQLTFTQRRNSTLLIEVLLRDGVIYYSAIMATSLMNFCIWIFAPFASYLAVGLLKCLQATICSRLLLNIRGVLKPELFSHSEYQPTERFDVHATQRGIGTEISLGIEHSIENLFPPTRPASHDFESHSLPLDDFQHKRKS